MRVLNLMFSQGLGGIEQAFLDYNQALLMQQHEVLAVTHPFASINNTLSGKLEHRTLANFGSWDPLAAMRLRAMARQWKAELVICHGNRALALAFHALGGLPRILVTHNYNLRHCMRATHVFALTADLARAARARGFNSRNITIIPNMVGLPKVSEPAENTPLVIGALGRFIPKKGFDLLVEAAAILAGEGKHFTLRLAGEGAEIENLQRQAESLGIAQRVEFTGWLNDTEPFFRLLDIFCLPSRHEPFGIALIEAMSYRLPVVCSRAEGPLDIVQEEEAMMVEVGSAPALVDGLRQLLDDPLLRSRLAEKARRLVENRYAIERVSRELDDALGRISERMVEA